MTLYYSIRTNKADKATMEINMNRYENYAYYERLFNEAIKSNSDNRVMWLWNEITTSNTPRHVVKHYHQLFSEGIQMTLKRLYPKDA